MRKVNEQWQRVNQEEHTNRIARKYTWSMHGSFEGTGLGQIKAKATRIFSSTKKEHHLDTNGYHVSVASSLEY